MENIAFSAPIQFGYPVLSKDHDFSGVAYTGGAMENGNGPYVIDLQALKWKDSIPLLMDHDSTKVVGVIDRIDCSHELKISGRLFASDPDGEAIITKQRSGLRWELSVGVFGSVRPVSKHESVFVNSRTQHGPFILMTAGILREVSVVALGADSGTSVTFSRPRRVGRARDRLILF